MTKSLANKLLHVAAASTKTCLGNTYVLTDMKIIVQSKNTTFHNGHWKESCYPLQVCLPIAGSRLSEAPYIIKGRGPHPQHFSWLLASVMSYFNCTRWRWPNYREGTQVRDPSLVLKMWLQGPSRTGPHFYVFLKHTYLYSAQAWIRDVSIEKGTAFK